MALGTPQTLRNAQMSQGIGSGARVAATVGTRCRGHIAGFVFISYPLKVGPHHKLDIDYCHMSVTLLDSLNEQCSKVRLPMLA